MSADVGISLYALTRVLLSKHSSASVISRPSFISVAAQVQPGWRDEEESVGWDSAE